MTLEAIVLAGGFGTRLREIVPDVPKPMAPIGNRPFLEILLTSLVQKKFSRIILSVGFMSNKIVEYFGNKFLDAELIYVVEENPLGTGGAIRLSLEQCLKDHIYVFNGDTYLDLEIDNVEQLWERSRLPIIVGREVPDTYRYGKLSLCDEKVIRLTEKGISGQGIINAGCYIIEKKQLDSFSLYSPFSFESDYLTHAVEKSSFNIFVSCGDFIDIGVPKDYERARNKLANI